MKRPDRHNEVELNMLERGSLTYLLGGRKVTIRPSLNVFRAAIPHQIIASEGKSDYLVANCRLRGSCNVNCQTNSLSPFWKARSSVTVAWARQDGTGAVLNVGPRI
jgi:hypothetical protein